jgi:hypothetical protein
MLAFDLVVNRLECAECMRRAAQELPKELDDDQVDDMGE